MRRVLILFALFLSVSLASWAAPPPPSSSVGYQANVELRVDDLGRFVVLIDRIGEGAEGLVDRAMVYEARDLLPSTPPLTLKGVSIQESYGDDLHKLKLRSEHSPFVSVDLEISPAASEAGEVVTLLPHSVVLRGGAAILSVSGRALWPDANDRELPPTFAHARTEHLFTTTSAEDAPFASGSGCASGGTGASGCRADCKGSILGIEIGEECDVTCGAGFHACCNCTGWAGTKAECTCIGDITNNPAAGFLSSSPR